MVGGLVHPDDIPHHQRFLHMLCFLYIGEHSNILHISSVIIQVWIYDNKVGVVQFMRRRPACIIGSDHTAC